MPDEKLYTLAEAKRELQRQECANYGHSWEVVTAFQGQTPVALICECGERKRVADDAEETK